MKPKDLFGVGFRLLSIVSLFYSFEYLLYYLDARLRWTSNEITNLGGTVEGYLIYTSFYGLAGGMGLTFSDTIVNAVYQDDCPEPEGDSESDQHQETDG